MAASSGNAGSTGPAGPVSFGFSRKAERRRLLAAGPCSEPESDGADIDYLKAVEDRELLSAKPAPPPPKELVIPLRPAHRWRNPEAPSSAPSSPGHAPSATNHAPDSAGHAPEGDPVALETAAVQELLREAKQSQQQGSETPSAAPIPMRMKEENVGSGALPTPEDYAAVPVAAFGMAMLRGMGWKQGEGIGRTFKRVVKPLEQRLRPRGLGLGAEAAPPSSSAPPPNLGGGGGRGEDPHSTLGGGGGGAEGGRRRAHRMRPPSRRLREGGGFGPRGGAGCGEAAAGGAGGERQSAWRQHPAFPHRPPPPPPRIRGGVAAPPTPPHPKQRWEKEAEPRGEDNEAELPPPPLAAQGPEGAMHRSPLPGGALLQLQDAGGRPAVHRHLRVPHRRRPPGGGAAGGDAGDGDPSWCRRPRDGGAGRAPRAGGPHRGARPPAGDSSGGAAGGGGGAGLRLAVPLRGAGRRG